MKALIDGDILQYEIGFAAETGWRAITEDADANPPFDYVKSLLEQRLEYICYKAMADDYTLYITDGPTFRYDIAKTQPYKGTRIEKKPWHYTNLSVYMTDVLGAKVVTGIEADDAMAIDHLSSGGQTVICSRDKDLRQVPGLSFSWELGAQPEWGPEEVSEVGYLELSEDRKKLKGTGFAFFCSQLLTGDRVDNIPGLPKYGPVAAYEILEGEYHPDSMMVAVQEYYKQHFPDNWEEYLLEQGQLLWIVRRLNKDGSPELWTIGQTK